MSKYVPFTQQRFCCVPASLSMVMYRQGIPLIPQEDLAYALGLTVPEDLIDLFGKARTGKKPSAGWGTRINEPEFEINMVLKGLGIPLSINADTHIKIVDELRTKLQNVQDADGDALICFDYGTLWNEDVNAGHVCVFDHLEGDSVWLVDPLPQAAKLRKTTIAQLLKAIDFHGSHNSCGIWVITSLSSR